ncbi:MAG: hypothetical protein ABEJ04_05210 [Halobacteriaceae archaeon]
MRLRDDDRAVTVQVGAVLLFAILVIFLSVYQAQVVPAENQRVEFRHGQTVHADLHAIRNAVVGAGTTGAAGPVTVALGATYPARVFFVNPPPVTGTLRTVGRGDLEVHNATAVDGEVADFWNGTARSFPTSALVYRAGYDEYRDAPATVYENTVLFDRFEGANLTLSGQRLLQGNRLTLVTLTGNLSASGVDAASVDPTALSAGRTVTVRNRTHNVSVRVPTALPASAWRDLLAAQFAGAGDGHLLRVADVDGERAVRLDLEPGTYELRLAAVSVGDGASDPAARYLTASVARRQVTDDDERVRLVVEARDRYNGPVTGASVDFSGTGDFEDAAGDDVTRPVETDDEGRAVVWYNASGSLGEQTVTASLNGSGDGARRVRFDVVNTGGDAGAASRFVVLSSQRVGGRNLSYVLDNRGSEVNLTGVRFNYGTKHRTNGTVSDGPTRLTAATVVGDARRSVTAEEGGAPAFFPTPVALGSGTSTLNLTADVGLDLADGEALQASVTLYFEGGVSDTYPVFVFGSGSGSTGGGGSSGGGQAPTINSYTTSTSPDASTRNPNDYEVTADFNVSDPQGWTSGADATVTVYRTSNGNQVGQQTVDLSSASSPYVGSATVGGLQQGTQYRVELVVADGQGHSASANRTVTP